MVAGMQLGIPLLEQATLSVYIHQALVYLLATRCRAWSHWACWHHSEQIIYPLAVRLCAALSTTLNLGYLATSECLAVLRT